MAEKIRNKIFVIHAKRGLAYFALWIWCVEHNMPVVFQRGLAALVRANTATLQLLV